MKRPTHKASQRPTRDRTSSAGDDARSRKRAQPGRSGHQKSAADTEQAPLKSLPAAAVSAAVGRSRSGSRSCADESSTDNPDIGFKKPPKAHSWKKGQSGNPKGRKKGTRNKKSVIISLMEGRLGRKIPDPKKLTAQEAMLWKAIQKGLAGDAKAMAFAFKRYDDATANSWTGQVITTDEDKQVYDALCAKLRREIKEEQ